MTYYPWRDAETNVVYTKDDVDRCLRELREEVEEKEESRLRKLEELFDAMLYGPGEEDDATC